jgi:hypothetical protein
VTDLRARFHRFASRKVLWFWFGSLAIAGVVGIFCHRGSYLSATLLTFGLAYGCSLTALLLPYALSALTRSPESPPTELTFATFLVAMGIAAVFALPWYFTVLAVGERMPGVESQKPAVLRMISDRSDKSNVCLRQATLEFDGSSFQRVCVSKFWHSLPSRAQLESGQAVSLRLRTNALGTFVCDIVPDRGKP